MKKILSLILTAVITLGCLCVALVPASAGTIETENGVQVEIAPFLYKSALYQMEFPSRQSYEIKEKSTEGDYAISREINDLSYTFVFPAGTTKIECMVSLDGEEQWRGLTINHEDHSNYWEKDDEGNIDYTKPLTFRRDEVLAERDEYGVLYRDYLMNTGKEGFKDVERIYWRLRFVCNGETLTDYFDLRVYDYDAAEKYELKAVNFNIAGLPFFALQGQNVEANQRTAAKYLSENDFDIAAVQEDFSYHSEFTGSLSGYEYTTNHMGNVPFGDGLSTFTRDMPIYNETRVEWNESSGILSDGSDELTPKGFVYTVIDAGNGIYIDFYNIHSDAYSGEGSVAARTSQYKQLAQFIKARLEENDRPVIVTGDFNNHMHVHEDDGALYETLYRECGLKDAWVEYHNNGDYFNMYEWHITGLPAWGNWDSVERFMYKSGGGVDIVVSDFRYVEVTDDNGNAVSDHSSAECDFTLIKTEDFVPNKGELSVTKAPENNFMSILMRIINDLIKILSDIANLPELIKELMP